MYIYIYIIYIYIYIYIYILYLTDTYGFSIVGHSCSIRAALLINEILQLLSGNVGVLHTVLDIA